MHQPAYSIISELEDAVSGGSSAKRVSTLRRVTDLFLHDAERLSDEQVKVFDDVLCFMIARVETRARAELAKRLAPVDYAPFEVIQQLAFDDEIEVAADVLTNSSRLGTEALVKIASTKSQDHLLAISGRANLPEAVTDVIVDRGEGKVIRRLANNASARFSEAGYSGMVAHAEADEQLIEILGLRVDLPVKFLRDLLRRHAAPRKRLGWIDLHTGLGPSGHGEKIYAGPDDTTVLSRAKRWWGGDVQPPAFGKMAMWMMTVGAWSILAHLTKHIWPCRRTFVRFALYVLVLPVWIALASRPQAVDCALRSSSRMPTVFSPFSSAPGR